MESNYVNALIHESSVYLQQHAHNPVNWFPWGEEALQAAQKSDKPILVSIGYSSCHWCHVMERESFEDLETAELMNAHFINIKIDREERPDLDQVYMEAVQLLTGSGGWPLNVFLTPDGRPFYGGTYFPPVRAYNKISWKEVLHSIHDAYINRRSEIEAQADQLKKHIEDSNEFGLDDHRILTTQPDAWVNFSDTEEITAALLKTADYVQGGFGYAPKFPQTFSLQYLLRYAKTKEDKKAGEFALLSIRNMFQGGIYDQLGGGLARYSTDTQWLVPHFEKMLYDNALFIILLSDAYRYSGEKIWEAAIHKTIHFLQTEMKDPQGGYYAAMDADSENEEGKFYVWEKSEIDKILGDDASLFTSYYQVSEKGNWEGKNILHIKQDAGYWAEQFGMKEADFLKKIEEGNRVLLEERAKRIRPITDDKIILSWNALLLKAFTYAYVATKHEPYKQEAIALAQFLQSTFTQEQGYGHVNARGQTNHRACLEDLAYWAEALICVQEITGNVEYLQLAKQLMEYILEHFSHPEKPVFYFTEEGQADLFVRKVDLFDGALPSANAVVLKNLQYLSAIFERVEWQVRAESMLLSTKEIVKKHPGSFGFWAGLILNNAIGIEEVVLTGTATDASLQDILPEFFSNKILISSNHNNEIPILQGKNFNKPVSIYICRNNSCSAPVNTLQELYTLIKNNSG